MIGMITGLHRKKAIRLTAIALVASCILSYFVGTFLGYLMPWGDPWSLHVVPRVTSIIENIRIMYAHERILTGGTVFVLFAVIAFYQKIYRDKLDWIGVATLAGYGALIFMPILLSGYAKEAYPNLLANFGGGQPRIVQLHFQGLGDRLAETLGDFIGGTRKSKSVMVTKPVALWYQDGNFVYIGPPQDDKSQGNTMVIAIDIKSIRAIQYRAGYIKVESGNNIIGINVSSLSD